MTFAYLSILYGNRAGRTTELDLLGASAALINMKIIYGLTWADFGKC